MFRLFKCKSMNKVLILLFSIILLFNCNENKKNNEVRKFQIEQKCNMTFETFFDKFSRDSIFQKKRIRFPLKESYVIDLESSKMQIDIIYSSEYSFRNFKLDKEAKNKEYGKYTVDIEKVNDTIVNYKHKGIDNGIYRIFIFKQIKACWHLTEILDKSA